MLRVLVFILLLGNSSVIFAQNYFQEYPITTTIVSNGTGYRIECATFDSALQIMVYYQSPWLNSNIFITGNHSGKVTFTTWITPVEQDEVYGFIIYDFRLHQFDAQIKTFNVAPNRNLNLIGGLIWIKVHEETYTGSVYWNYFTYYRYNMELHKWVTFTIGPVFGTSSTLWNIFPTGNSDLNGYIDDLDEGDFYYYDPVGDFMNYFSSGCAGWGFQSADDYVAMDMGCLDNYRFMTYDAEMYQYKEFGRPQLLGGMSHGIFFAAQQDTSNPRYFFTYDQAIHEWLADSVFSDSINSWSVKDRVWAYLDHTPGYPQSVFYMVHDPLQNALVKDSTPVNGVVTSLSVQNGTVTWTDSGGSHIRGYDVNSGWGNYTTPLFLYFHLTEFTSAGQPMIHVRNYSIGTEKVFYDFGDGVVSLNNRHVLWHSYRDSGIYDVCIYDSSGTQSWCQQVNMNTILCSHASAIGYSNDTICEGDTVILSLANYAGTIQWQHFDGSNWINETGPGFDSSVYVITPQQSATYRAVVTNGNCLPAYSNEQYIHVFSDISGYLLSDTSLMVCQGQSVSLSIINTGNAAVQWQSFYGGNWSNVSGAGNLPNYYPVIASDSLFRVLISSGNCFADTSMSITVDALQVPPPPITTNDTTCGPGTVNLNASGNGLLYWYLSTFTDSAIYTGSNYSTFINNTTTYYVSASNGTDQAAGYADNSIGPVSPGSSQPTGIRFFSSDAATLKHVYVYPIQSGSIQFKLFNSLTGQLIATRNFTVTGGSGKIPLYVNLPIQGNLTYDLMVTLGNQYLSVNNGGANYPLNIPGSPVTILGYVDSVFHTSPDYYNFYDWYLQTGCQSVAASVKGVVVSPLTATIVPNGPIAFCQGDSVTFTASPMGNLSYSWLRNNIPVPGATGNSYVAHSPGTYQVYINNSLCGDTSNSYRVTIPCLDPFDPQQKETIEPANQVQTFSWVQQSSVLILTANVITDENYSIILSDPSGRIVYSSSLTLLSGNNTYQVSLDMLTAGIYFLRMENGTKRYVRRIVKF